MKKLDWVVLYLLCCTANTAQLATDTDVETQRTKNHYILFCQGCHGVQGVGRHGNVPRIKNFMGNFLQVEGGREFLVQVPGSAYSALDNKQLAQLLNWMLVQLSPNEIPDNFVDYSAGEVKKLRAMALTDVESVRKKLITKMQAQGIDIAENTE